MDIVLTEKYEATIMCFYKKNIRNLRRWFGWFSSLKYQGYDRKKEARVYTAQVTRNEFDRLSEFAHEQNMTVKLINGFTARQVDCRERFFKSYKQKDVTWRGTFYRCVYCGRKYDRSKIEVDHLYPVDAVQKDPKLQTKLKLKGWDSVNDMRNLVPACKRCNRSKSNKLGWWIVKGTIGRHEVFWKIRNVCLLIVVLLLIWLFREQAGQTLHVVHLGICKIVNWLIHEIF